MSRHAPATVLATLAALLFSPGLHAEQSPSATIRDAIARIEKNPDDWKARIAALRQIALAGPAAAPVLIEALNNGSPIAKELAAQALVLIPDPANRPALEKALDHPKSGVRLYAIQALSMFGPLSATERYQHMLENDPSHWGVQQMLAAALARQDKPDAETLRKTLVDYDLAAMDTARLGELAPDSTVTAFTGKTQRLSQMRNGRVMVLRFLLYDH